MKDLLSKKHYFNKIHTLLMKSSAYFHFFSIDSHPLWTTLPSSNFFKKILILHSSMIFQKSQPHYK